MKKTITRAALAVAAIAMLGSCAKQEYKLAQTPMSEQAIEVRSYNGNTGSQMTKAAIVGTTMPIDRDLVISAYYNKPGESASQGVDYVGGENGNYFENILFSYNSEKQTWTSAGEPMFWPLKGTLDFLAYSAEDSQIRAQWNKTNCADSVILDHFAESYRLSDDILFAQANGQCYSLTGVPMEFQHAKTLIVFTAKASNANAITITKIEIDTLQQIDKDKTQLWVKNNKGGKVSAKWNKSYVEAHDVAVPGIDNISYNVPVKAMDVTKKASYLGIGGQGIMIPEQKMTRFTVYFEQKSASGNVIKESFTYNCQIGNPTSETETEWKMGKRYVYELNFKVNEIEVNASVAPWDDSAADNVTEVDIPEAANLYFANAKAQEYTMPEITLKTGTKLIIDWGDETEPDEYVNDYTKAAKVEGATCTPKHTYAAAGDYYIKFYVGGEGVYFTEGIPWAMYAHMTILDPEKFSPDTQDWVTLGDNTWATCNLGASTPWESGNFYFWAGTTGYKYVNSKWVSAVDGSELVGGFVTTNAPYYDATAGNYTKYTEGDSGDEKTVLEAADDAAVAAGIGKTPTIEQFTSLYNDANYWTDNYEGTGECGRVFGIASSNDYNMFKPHIFLPAAGYGNRTSLSNAGGGDYWSSSLMTGATDYAQLLCFSSSDVFTSLTDRYFGNSVRPVSE